jgi:hypothetical protein
MKNGNYLYFRHHQQDFAFYSVGMFFIVAGAAFFIYGIIGWLSNVAGNQNITFSFPSEKILGGMVVMLLAYIVLELELLRSSQK